MAKTLQVLESVATLIRIIRDLCASGIRCNSKTLDFLHQQIEKMGVLPGFVRQEPNEKQLAWWNVLKGALTRGRTLIEKHTKNIDLQSVCKVFNVVHQVERICVDMKSSLVALKLGEVVKIDVKVDSSRVAKDMMYMEWYLTVISEKIGNGLKLNECIRNELQLLKIKNEPQMQRVRLIQERDITWGTSLGQGGFGEVFEARWADFNVAVKIVSLQLDRLSVEVLTEYLTSVGTHMQLKHPNVVQCFSATKTGCIVMQRADQSVQDLYRKAEKLQWGVKLNIMGQAAEGLKYLHDQGILHRGFNAPTCWCVGATLENTLLKFRTLGILWSERRQNVANSGRNRRMPIAGWHQRCRREGHTARSLMCSASELLCMSWHHSASPTRT